MVNSSDVVLDDIWAWRADHGTGVGWTVNTADTGVVVNGDDVTAYGLFVEHYQKNEVIWNGQRRQRDVLPERDALRPAEPGRLAAEPDQPRLSRRSRSPRPVKSFTGYGHGQLQLLQPGHRHPLGDRLPGAHDGVSLHSLLTVSSTGPVASTLSSTAPAPPSAPPTGRPAC